QVPQVLIENNQFIIDLDRPVSSEQLSTTSIQSKSATDFQTAGKFMFRIVRWNGCNSIAAHYAPTVNCPIEQVSPVKLILLLNAKGIGCKSLALEIVISQTRLAVRLSTAFAFRVLVGLIRIWTVHESILLSSTQA